MSKEEIEQANCEQLAEILANEFPTDVLAKLKGIIKLAFVKLESTELDLHGHSYSMIFAYTFLC